MFSLFAHKMHIINFLVCTVLCASYFLANYAMSYRFFSIKLVKAKLQRMVLITIAFSFLMSLPVIVGMTLVKIVMEAKSIMMHPGDFLIYIVGGIIAGIVGYWSIKIVIRFIVQKYFKLFAIYCWIMGLFIVIMNLARNS